MSADNGVYVLYTDTNKGPEYRVAYSHAIDNIYGEFDDETGHFAGNADAIVETFGDRKVFHNLNEALDVAEEVAAGHEYLEDGVCTIYSFSHLNPFREEKDD
jgi:hypothetical protein